MENSSSTAPFDLHQFLGAMSHDLANPLNAISMNAELARLLAQKNQTERVPEVVERVLGDCSRCSRFLRDLRQFADATRPRERESVGLQALVDTAEMNARAAVTGIFPQLSVVEPACTVRVQRQPMESAIAAILRNAAEAGARTIRIDCEKTAGTTVLRFTDDGPGFPEAALGKAGAPFFSTRRQQGNTGLGLALCRYVARAHGGELELRGGAGPEVRITLADSSP